MDMFKGKTAIVTGASRGIGAAVARELAQLGFHLALIGRDEKTLNETKETCQIEEGQQIGLYACDLSDMNLIAGMLQDIKEDLGSIDVLINNAGIFAAGRGQDCDLEKWDLAIDLNLRSHMHLARHCLPGMIEKNWGAVIAISSIAGKFTQGGGGNYCATKWGVLGYMGSLFDDVRDHNVKVSTICPGYVDTEMVPKRMSNRHKMIQPEDIAQTVSFILQFPKTGCPVEITVRPQNDVNKE